MGPSVSEDECTIVADALVVEGWLKCGRTQLLFPSSRQFVQSGPEMEASQRILR